MAPANLAVIGAATTAAAAYAGVHAFRLRQQDQEAEAEQVQMPGTLEQAEAFLALEVYSDVNDAATAEANAPSGMLRGILEGSVEPMVDQAPGDALRITHARGALPCSNQAAQNACLHVTTSENTSGALACWAMSRKSSSLRAAMLQASSSAAAVGGAAVPVPVEAAVAAAGFVIDIFCGSVDDFRRNDRSVPVCTEAVTRRYT